MKKGLDCIVSAAMDFGVFTMFSTREGSTQRFR